MIELYALEIFILMMYFIITAFLAKEVLARSSLRTLHSISYATLALALGMMIRFIV